MMANEGCCSIAAIDPTNITNTWNLYDIFHLKV
jgi:hypothetical protein